MRGYIFQINKGISINLKLTVYGVCSSESSNPNALKNAYDESYPKHYNLIHTPNTYPHINKVGVFTNKSTHHHFPNFSADFRENAHKANLYH